MYVNMKRRGEKRREGGREVEEKQPINLNGGVTVSFECVNTNANTLFMCVCVSCCHDSVCMYCI